MATLKQIAVTNRIKDMLNMGLSKRRIAQELGVSYGVVSHIKTGRTQMVSAKTAEQAFEQSEQIRKTGPVRLWVFSESGRDRAPGQKFSRPIPASETDRRAILDYRDAVKHFFETGDDSRLRRFKGKSYSYATTKGKRSAVFETDPDRLAEIAETGEYESVIGQYQGHETYT